jgi:hypothetical protein
VMMFEFVSLGDFFLNCFPEMKPPLNIYCLNAQRTIWPRL